MQGVLSFVVGSRGKVAQNIWRIGGHSMGFIVRHNVVRRKASCVAYVCLLSLVIVNCCSRRTQAIESVQSHVDTSIDATSEVPGPASLVTPLKRFADKARIAVAQIQIDPYSLDEGQTSVDELIPWMKRAAAEKADLLVFPEYLLGHFHLRDDLTTSLCEAASKFDLNVVVGGWEFLPGEDIVQPPEPGTYFNTVLVIDRDGNIAGKHQKMHAAVGAASPYCWPPEPGERGEHTMIKGTGNAVVDLDFGRIGLLTCYDGYFFESFQMPSLRGAEILVWVNARQGMVEPHIVKAASFITCTHVVASNQSVGSGSAICSYPGWEFEAVATSPAKEAFLVADLDLATLRKERLNNRMMHQRRPEIYGPITQQWKPWEAYPDLQPFRHDSPADPRLIK